MIYQKFTLYSVNIEELSTCTWYAYDSNYVNILESNVVLGIATHLATHKPCSCLLLRYLGLRRLS